LRRLSVSEVERRANALWNNIASGERQAYEERAKEANENPPKKEETKVARARKLASHIRTCISKPSAVNSCYYGHGPRDQNLVSAKL